jgi:hypothetical protein
MIVDFDDTDYSLIVSAQDIERYKLMEYLDEVLSFPTLTQDYLSCPDPRYLGAHHGETSCHKTDKTAKDGKRRHSDSK